MFDLFFIKGGVTAPSGFFADGLCADTTDNQQADVAFIYSESACKIFATSSHHQTPPNHSTLESNFVLIHASNAPMRDQEIEASTIITHTLTTRFPQLKSPIIVSSGFKGVHLPIAKIIHACEQFDLNMQESHEVANVMTTANMSPIEIALEVKTPQGRFRIGAIASYTSHAAILCFITTDALLDEQGTLIFHEMLEDTFGAISTEGMDSTHDTIMLMANSKSGVCNTEAFKFALKEIMHKLALTLISNHQNTSKLIAFEAKNALNKAEAKKAAQALSSSMQIKDTLATTTPNWGYIASIIRTSGVKYSAEKLSIYCDSVCVCHQGHMLLDETSEANIMAIMKQDQMCITCDLGMGYANFRAYTTLKHQLSSEAN